MVPVVGPSVDDPNIRMTMTILFPDCFYSQRAAKHLTRHCSGALRKEGEVLGRQPEGQESHARMLLGIGRNLQAEAWMGGDFDNDDSEENQLRIS